MEEVSDAVSDEIYSITRGMSLGGLWSYARYSPGWVVPAPFAGFDGQKKFFFCCLRRFMTSKLLVLHKAGELLCGTVEEQLKLFSSSFPHSEEEVDIGGDAIWFYTESCPCEPAWVMKGDDGKERLDWA